MRLDGKLTAICVARDGVRLVGSGERAEGGVRLVAGAQNQMRRGRREAPVDLNSPSHRRELAEQLRKLRHDCGNPSYRTLSRLCHCGSGSLSEAANGRRVPTWEVTRAYVTGCLVYANRTADIQQELRRWRRRWQVTAELERLRALPVADVDAGTAPTTCPTPVVSIKPKRSGASVDPITAGAGGTGSWPGVAAVDAEQRCRWCQRGRRVCRLLRAATGQLGLRRQGLPVAIAAGLTALLATTLAGSGLTQPPPPMSGLFNILLVPFTAVGTPGSAQSVAERLQVALVGELKLWSHNVAHLQLRGPDGIEGITSSDVNRDRLLEAMAQRHAADLIVTGHLRGSGEAITVMLEIFVNGRTLAETPEFVGRHQISLTEPADALAGNWILNQRLTTTALTYVSAVVEFIRGLGAYALDDFAQAENRFTAAKQKLSQVRRATHSRTEREEVVHLMLGNAVGRHDRRRLAEAADHYRRALNADPSYARARIGLAEATRATVRCRPDEADETLLQKALDDYRTALATLPASGHVDREVLEMKTRLGLGLTLQCLSVAGLADRWSAANTEFRLIIRVQETAHLSASGNRQALWLAAEAAAGQGLIALLTAAQPGGERYGGYPAAATAYEHALTLLHRIGAVRPTILQRERIFLCNLGPVYVQLQNQIRLQDVTERISTIDATLATAEHRTPVTAADDMPARQPC